MLFGAANESAYYADFTVKCFRIYLCLMPLATLNKGTFIYLQALGKAFAFTAVSLTCEIIFGVCFPIILPTSDVLRARRSAVVVPNGRSADLLHCNFFHPADLSGAFRCQHLERRTINGKHSYYHYYHQSGILQQRAHHRKAGVRKTGN